MNDCVALDDEMVDVAFGAEPSEAFALHLRSCGACALRLSRREAVARRIDAAVGAIVRSEPPTVAEPPAARTVAAGGPPFWGRLRATLALAAAACVLIAAVVLAGRHGPMHATDVTALTAWRSPTNALLKPLGSVLDAPLRSGATGAAPRKTSASNWRTL